MPATGAETLMRSSNTLIHQLYAPPPLRPVTPNRFLSTKSRVSKKSNARMQFHASTEDDE